MPTGSVQPKWADLDAERRWDEHAGDCADGGG